MVKVIKSQKDLDKFLEGAGDEPVLLEGFTGKFIGKQFCILTGNSRGVFWENSSGEFRENSSGVFRENSSGVFRENSRGVFCGNSSGEFRGNSRGVLYDFAHAHVMNNNKIEKISPKASITKVSYPKSVKGWLSLKGIKPDKKGNVILWKTVRTDGSDFRTGQINYLSGVAVAPDWDKDAGIECGNGLHLADSQQAAIMFVPTGDDYRLLKVKANIKDIVVFGGNPEYPMKCRAKQCVFVEEIDPKTI